jgi:hypothetical protein
MQLTTVTPNQYSLKHLTRHFSCVALANLAVAHKDLNI